MKIGVPQEVGGKVQSAPATACARRWCLRACRAPARGRERQPCLYPPPSTSIPSSSALRYSPLPPSASLPVAFRAQRLLPQKLIALTSKSIIAALARLIDAPEKIADVLKVIVAQIKDRHTARCDVTGRAAVRLASSRGIAPKQTHVIERGLYCFLELGALHVLRRSGIARRSPVLLDDRR
jgi:hypothetical protein